MEAWIYTLECMKAISKNRFTKHRGRVYREDSWKIRPQRPLSSLLGIMNFMLKMPEVARGTTEGS